MSIWEDIPFSEFHLELYEHKQRQAARLFKLSHILSQEDKQKTTKSHSRVDV